MFATPGVRALRRALPNTIKKDWAKKTWGRESGG
jgi:hypothetical protein